MNWNDQAKNEADRLHEAGLSVSGFALGAKWQRDQLRTNEAVERVAGLFSGWIGCPDCAHSHAPICDRCKDFAEWSITALLGEEPCHR